MKQFKRVLSIAGSDPSGGAGIQADLKAMSACGCYGMTAITAVVDENTQGVTGVYPIPVDFVKGQIHSVLDDIGADAVKIGMLHSSELIRGVCGTLHEYAIENSVLDPVMVATSGDRLLAPDAAETLKKELIPHVRVITPNIPEAEILAGCPITSVKDMDRIAPELSCNGTVSVWLKAGHLNKEELIDVFFNAETNKLIHLKTVRVQTNNTHGTGCTLSSALASFLARGYDLNDAVFRAKNYLTGALEAAKDYKTGRGHGPVHHFFQWWT